MQRCPLDTKPEAFQPNLKGLIPEQQVIDAQKRMVAAAVKDLPTWQKILVPKNWPTKVKVAVSAAVGAALVASGVGQEIVAPILSLLFGG